MRGFRLQGLALALWVGLAFAAQAAGVDFTVRSARSGSWSDPATRAPNRVPRAGDLVQVRPGHRVTSDAASDQAIRLPHVSGTLTFARECSTRLDADALARPASRGEAPGRGNTRTASSSPRRK
jgi:hypothetical protein